ncbi:phage antirepressor KilAC domain-containing protein [Campylobacter concisus]|jgi:hypothetical protein|uniref:phage antirepressor KilAC domain-containing protein n=1 Tax=Campylobacter concisus TaxID=199 RepID=UPI000CD9507A|nr:phage antirepressor KilAC domain-containing protein [Campylobacter concisus]
MNTIVTFNNLDLEVLEYKDTWSLSNKQVADGFGVSESTVREQKRTGEYVEGVHFYLSENLTGNAKQTFWTKKGVITLGFKLRETPQTILFRDWASDFILNSSNRPLDIQNVLADPRVFAQLALRYADEQDKNKQLEHKIEADAPYVDFARAVEVSKGDIKIGEYAKILCNKDKSIDTGEIRLFALMRELGILMFNNEPLQKYLNMGYFRRKPQTFTKPNGEQGLSFITLITPRGQVKLAKKLIEAIKAKNTPRIKS